MSATTIAPELQHAIRLFKEGKGKGFQDGFGMELVSDWKLTEFNNRLELTSTFCKMDWTLCHYKNGNSEVSIFVTSSSKEGLPEVGRSILSNCEVSLNALGSFQKTIKTVDQMRQVTSTIQSCLPEHQDLVLRRESYSIVAEVFNPVDNSFFTLFASKYSTDGELTLVPDSIKFSDSIPQEAGVIRLEDLAKQRNEVLTKEWAATYIPDNSTAPAINEFYRTGQNLGSNIFLIPTDQIGYDHPRRKGLLGKGVLLHHPGREGNIIVPQTIEAMRIGRNMGDLRVVTHKIEPTGWLNSESTLVDVPRQEFERTVRHLASYQNIPLMGDWTSGHDDEGLFYKAL